MKTTFRQYVPEFVYGAVDGTVTTFAVVAASAGAGISSAIVLVLGAANLLADGFSMGSSAYLSASAESDKTINKRRSSPKIIGLATFGAFLVVGSMPILPYLVDVVGGLKISEMPLFYISSAATTLTFLAIGFVKGRVAGENPVKAALVTFGLGAAAASLAYFAGNVLAAWLGVEL